MEALAILAWVVGVIWIGERIAAWHPEAPPRLARALRDTRIVSKQDPRIPTHEAVGMGVILGWVAFLLALVLS